MTKRNALPYALFALFLFLAPSIAVAFEPSAPPGYVVSATDDLASGVRHVTFTSVGDEHHVAHAAFVPRNSGAVMRVAAATPATENPRGPLARTSDLCVRLACIVGVNGPMKERESGRSIGAVVEEGELIRTPPEPERAVSQLMILADGSAVIGALEWTATLLSEDAEISIGGVNVARDADSVVVYTPRFGPTTETDAEGFELVFQASEPVRLGRTMGLELIEGRDHQRDTPIPKGGGVISGHGRGAEQLRALWSRIVQGAAPANVTLRATSALGVTQSVGGRPVLVRDGRKVSLTARDRARIDGRHPRTLAGRTASGELFIVTIDGRQVGYSDGVTLDEAADAMLGMGAVDAINLDGGGSSTFVVRGAVTNRPSDRLVGRGGHQATVASPGPKDHVIGHVERAVSAALVVVAAPVPPPTATPSARPQPRSKPAQTPTVEAVAPRPERGPDGLALSQRHAEPPPIRPAAIALALWLAVGVSFGLARRRLGAQTGH